MDLIQGVTDTKAKERLVTQAIQRYARVHNEYARTVRQDTVLRAAAIREWNEWQQSKTAKASGG